MRTLIKFAIVLGGCWMPAQMVLCQVAPAASGAPLQLSVFGAGTGNWTGFDGGHNLVVTAGADLGFRSFRGFLPSAEIRGAYPVVNGHVDSEKDLLGGVRVEYPFGRFHPYGDFLAGRGLVDYQNGGYTVGALVYTQSDSTVLSPGGGVDYDLFGPFGIKGDVQYQHWDTPVTTKGSFDSKVVSVGVVYRFGFDGGRY